MRGELRIIRRSTRGLSLVELLVTMVVTGVLTGAIYKTFKHQQDTSLVQQHITAVHQNLRGAMNLMISDIRMAGFYSGLDTRNRNFFDWDPRNGAVTDSFEPSLSGVDGDDDDDQDGIPDDGDGIVDMPGFLDRSDIIMLVMAGSEQKLLLAGNGGGKGDSAFLVAGPLEGDGGVQLDGEGGGDLNDKPGGKNYGILAGADLGWVQLFRITKVGAGDPATIEISQNLKGDFAEGDTLARADILIYSIDPGNDSFDGPVLTRRNVGKGDDRLVVAENISDLDVAYGLDDGVWVNDPTGLERSVAAVSVTLESTVEVPVVITVEKVVDGKREKQREKLRIRRTLTSTVKIRNR